MVVVVAGDACASAGANAAAIRLILKESLAVCAQAGVVSSDVPQKSVEIMMVKVFMETAEGYELEKKLNRI